MAVNAIGNDLRDDGSTRGKCDEFGSQAENNTVPGAENAHRPPDRYVLAQCRGRAMS